MNQHNPKTPAYEHHKVHGLGTLSWSSLNRAGATETIPYEGTTNNPVMLGKSPWCRTCDLACRTEDDSETRIACLLGIIDRGLFMFFSKPFMYYTF